MALCTAILTVNGGPPSALVQLFFLPVLLSAVRFNLAGGLVAGAACGILAGPVSHAAIAGAASAPSTGLAVEWLTRIVTMSIIGATFGGTIAHIRTQARHASIDVPTALPNMHGLRRLALKMLRRRRRNGPGDAALTKAALRVTNYQTVVNAFGYPVADEAMRQIGQKLNEELPDDALLARVSPNTFAIVTQGTRRGFAERCTDLVSRVENASIVVDDVPLYPDIVVGLADTTGAEPDVERLFSDAESAVTEAETTGPSIAVHDPSRRHRQQDRVRLLGEVGSAIRSGQITLAYQPRIDLRTFQVNGVEALARWYHPVRGWVSPAEFVPLLEQTRLVDGFTRQVLQQAIAQMASWKARGRDFPVAVNVSAHNLTNASLVTVMRELTGALGVKPEALELEITESAFMDITPEKIRLLHDIRSAGTRIAIDDFGTGYASLAYLRKLPVDVLKLDKSFIQEGLGRRQDHLMVHRIVQMAKDRHLRVVAEGVETEETLRTVRDLGCDEAQGYFIAPPLAPDDVEEVTVRPPSSEGVGP